VLDASVVDLVYQMRDREEINAVLGFDARGFLFGFPLALEFRIPFIPVRKKDKLPGELATVSFEKEYGKDTLSIQKKLITPGMKVLIHDDLLATGGTALAAVELVTSLGAAVFGFHFVMELGYLGAREKLEQIAPVISMVNFKTPEE
jgi:adenine phosphoribosyltransferase